MRRLGSSKGKKPTQTEKAIDALQCYQAELSNVRQTPIADMYYREYEKQLVPAEGSTDVALGESIPMPYTFNTETEDDYVVADALSTDVIIDTLSQPDIDAVAIDASLSRTRILHDAGALELGLDMATTIKAKNSMEKALAHQMAVLHAKSMEYVVKAGNGGFPRGHEAEYEIKMMNLAVRLMDSYQRGMETLTKVRNSGKQTIVVKQIKVEGGQNIIADNIQGGRRS